MRVAVLGVGLIGGSIGRAAKARVPGAEVVGFGRSPERLHAAHELGAIDRVAGSLEEALDDAEVCFACAPVGALTEQVEEALAAAGPDCVVTDVGSVKRRLVEAIDDQRFVGGHPIAGAETSGAEHSRADLFEGALWYLTPTERTSGLLYERLHRLIAALGARPVAVDADVHDGLVGVFSHLPHVVANELALRAAERLSSQGEALRQVGPSFRDATRVAGANSAIWTSIYLANRDAIASEVRGLARSLDKAAEMLEANDPGAVEDWNEKAREARRALLEADLAGGHVHELRLTVPNRPGLVAQVALELGRAGVNILDMTLSPAADMRSGAMSLWIAGDEQADRASELIGELGFPVARG